MIFFDKIRCIEFLIFGFEVTPYNRMEKILETKKTVVIVAGPTASGKSAFALREAQNYSSSIILNGDSQQLYAGLPILTALPSLEDHQTVPHYLYGHLGYNAPQTSVAEWRNAILPWIEEAHQKNRVPWIVGGTGFYLEGLLKGFSPIPFISPEAQEKLRHQWEHLPSLLLHGLLKEKDPVLHQKLSPGDRQRITRALVVQEVTGKPLSHWQTIPPSEVAPYTFYKILISPPKERLSKSIAARWKIMLQQGVIEEVKEFCTRPKYETSPLCHAIGFKEISAYLKGAISKEILDTVYLQKIHQYAKRQRCWFLNRFVPDKVIC